MKVFLKVEFSIKVQALDIVTEFFKCILDLEENSEDSLGKVRKTEISLRQVASKEFVLLQLKLLSVKMQSMGLILAISVRKKEHRKTHCFPRKRNPDRNPLPRGLWTVSFHGIGQHEMR